MDGAFSLHLIFARMNACFMYLVVCSAFGEINDDDDRDTCVMGCFCGLNKSH